MPALSDLSVIVPLVDDRDHAEECLAGWLGQSAGGERIEIVLVTDGRNPAQDHRLRARLRPGDRLVECSSPEEIALYQVGARAARSGLLLFTESHCLPVSDAAGRLLRFFAAKERRAGWLASACVAPNALARMEARLYQEEKRARRDPDDWRHVSLRGFAIRRHEFERAGGFEEAYGRFAEAVLARRLQRLGVPLFEVPGPLVLHVNCASFQDLSAALEAHGRGQAVYRERCEAGFGEEILAPSQLWSRRAGLSRPVAREAALLLLRSLWLDRGRPNREAKAHHALRALPRLAAAALLGSRGALLGAKLRSRAAALQFHLGFGEDRRFRSYVRLWTSLLALGMLRHIAGSPSALAGPLGSGAVLRPGEMPDGSLAGFHAPERWGEETCRWSGPCAMVRLHLEPGDYRVRLDLRSPVRPEERCLRLFFNGRPIPRKTVREEVGEVSFILPRQLFVPGAEQRLELTCAPFRPLDHGLPDPRELGAAVFSIEVEGVDAAALSEAR